MWVREKFVRRLSGPKCLRNRMEGRSSGPEREGGGGEKVGRPGVPGDNWQIQEDLRERGE